MCSLVRCDIYSHMKKWDYVVTVAETLVEIPDLLIERTREHGIYLPVDAKYKLYDQQSIATGDIYQTFLYAYAYGEKHSTIANAFFLYPASSPDGGQLRLHIRRSGGTTSAQLRSIPIPIPTALAEAQRGLAGPVATGLVRLVEQALTPSPRSPASSPFHRIPFTRNSGQAVSA